MNKKPSTVSANPEERNSLLLQQEKQNTNALWRTSLTKPITRNFSHIKQIEAHKNTL